MIIRKIRSEDILSELIGVGADTKSFEHFIRKGETFVYKLYDVDSRAANILKQEFLSLGGDVALHRDVAGFKIKKTDCLVIGTLKIFKGVLDKLEKEPYFGLGKIKDLLKEVLEKKKLPVLNIRGHEFDFNKRHFIMGVLNVTPDSFSDGGKFLNPQSALEHAKKMIEEGADIIDIGGESTRPGAEAVTENEELSRVIPLIKGIRKFSDIPISIDTYKSKVAWESLNSGADILNDISGLRFDRKMIEVAHEYNAPVIVMHIKGTPKDMQKNPSYRDLMRELLEYFEERISTLRSSGIDKIIIDPGVGFGKGYEDNLTIVRNLSEFSVFNLPILVGLSRKSFIGKTLDNRDVSERLFGTISANVLALVNGAHILRVHDVKPHKDLLKIFEAVSEPWKKERIFIAIGTNLGNKEENIQKAIKLISEGGVKIVKTSSLYETEPYGNIDQPDFLNAVIEVETDLSPEELLKVLLSIEGSMGRVRREKWGPRIIDLDIIFYGDRIVKEENLTIPHPDMQNRDFVLKPLSEIAGEYIHPVLNKTVNDLLKFLKKEK